MATPYDPNKVLDDDVNYTIRWLLTERNKLNTATMRE